MSRLVVLFFAGALFSGCVVLDGLETVESFRGCSVLAYSIGQYRTGLLNNQSCAVEGGRRINYYEITVAERRRIAIDLESSEFDTYLYLFSRTGDLIAENDDIIPFLNTDSRIVEYLEPGRYIVGVSTYSRGGNGRYTLTSRFRT